MTLIQPQDLADSVADALQHISVYHPLDYIEPWPRPMRWRSRRLPATLSPRS